MRTDWHGRALAAALICIPLLACSTAAPEASAQRVAAAELTPYAASQARPDGVATCYTELSSQHPAVLELRRTMADNDRDARPAALSALRDAAATYPNEEELALLLALGTLWQVSEPQSGELLDLSMTLDALALIPRELERAYSLCPTDHRIPGWLGPFYIMFGKLQLDSDMVAKGERVLAQGLDRYPAFVSFGKALAYADRPASDPLFQEAIAALRQIGQLCEAGSKDPACTDTPQAPHNAQGFLLFVGDFLTKAGDRAGALEAYNSAGAVPNGASWPLRDVLQQRRKDVDLRAQIASVPIARNLQSNAWNDFTCSACHAR